MKRNWCSAAFVGGVLAFAVGAAGCGGDPPVKQISAESLGDNDVVLQVNGMV